MSVKAWENGPSYIDMPSSMDSYNPPFMPDPDDVRHLDGAREAMDWLRAALSEWRDRPDPPVADLRGLDAESRELVNQVLGEGEVSITASGDTEIRVQESVLAGVWRTLHFDADGKIAIDLVEVAPVPHVVRTAFEKCAVIDPKANGESEDFGNALPILVELAAAIEKYKTDGTEHSINLTLLPMSEEELEFIDRRLGRGPVDILSRAYGKCQVTSTAAANTWWVRYYNSMGTLILNTIEVVNVPPVVAAAPEDLDDSATRLEEILAPYWADES